ncbi:hypothetical protein [Longimicrobium sp.]|uniref:hypothetical protein n=1 Tax=Longimicrobium sp. TaxID=2029185 RepID=UPI002BF18741|nr:hypothetical protein [Longimicrobium sp.]HSU17541.1 hypothetical protein [Longimicrobium sp.]
MSLAIARQVVSQIKALGIASTNRPADRATYGEDVVRDRNQALMDAYWEGGALALEGKAKVKAIAAAVRLHRIGNCEEKAYLAFDMLATRGVRPLELMAVSQPDDDPPDTVRGAISGIQEDFGGPDHAFVVIGRVGGNLRDYRTWNEGTVVCDPWAGRAYYCELFDEEMELIRRVTGGYTRTQLVVEHRQGAW